MLKIGLTGGIASGKSTVSRIFSQWDIPVIDADIIARELVAPGQAALDAIISCFGPALLTAEGTLDRQQLRELVFTDPRAKKTLEAILHPEIRRQIHHRAETLTTAAYCIIVVPLLIECGWQEDVDRILLVDCDQACQLRRLQQRDGLTAEQAMAIIRSQSTRSQRHRFADDVIINNRSYDDLQQQLRQLDTKYRQLAQYRASTD